jgi:hypothetical protein
LRTKAEIAYLDIEGAEECFGMEPIETLTLEQIFDARRAMALLGEATSRLSGNTRLREKQPRSKS